MSDASSVAQPFGVLPKRFLDKVEFEPNSGCWLWTAALSSGGYGSFGYGPDCKPNGAHRFSYEQLVGPIPDGIDLHHHTCWQHSCVNPDHLRPVPHSEHIAGHMRIRHQQSPNANARKQECIRGHQFTEENTYRWRSIRQCRVCIRLRGQRAKVAQ